MSDGGLICIEPESGKMKWKLDAAAPGAPISLQPHVLDGNRVLIPSSADFGLVMLEVKRVSENWDVQKRWSSRSIRPSFNDFVVHDGHAYGFDSGIFRCIDVRAIKILRAHAVTIGMSRLIVSPD